MNREETFNEIATLLEEGVNGNWEIEVTAERIMEALEVIGEDLLNHLDPPVGLRTWLESHGLSLVVTSEITPPQVWAALQEDDEEPGDKLEVTDNLQLGLGDYVEYATQPTGPRGQSQLGSGWVVSIAHDTIEVEFSPGGARIILFPGEDSIRIVATP